MANRYTQEFLDSLVGKQFGRLTIKGTGKDVKLGTICHVKCSCGKTRDYKVTVVLHGRVVSCGCKASENIPKVGERFINNKGNWCTVVDPKKWDDIVVKFENTGTVKSFQADSLKRKIFHDPFERSYWDYGFMGLWV